MKSSMVSSMVLVLLLLLVFPHMDKALGAQEGAKKQSGEDTYHPNGFVDPRRLIPHIPCFNCRRKPEIFTPPIPYTSFEGTQGVPGH
ncbi:hypothetical protein CARUB_v10027457mg [Capsella rubella]|uniref:Uncharacterized protein n=1 Tax=Capsella rubella TaxID=81985 RepID=R0EZ94_9BRAS|nr:hypothetical protein CARUB_v10027457mg [Capsella rubella]